ncbi:unnamed protein product, partial [Polarella glacialis]
VATVCLGVSLFFFKWTLQRLIGEPAVAACECLLLQCLALHTFTVGVHRTRETRSLLYEAAVAAWPPARLKFSGLAPTARMDNLSVELTANATKDSFHDEQNGILLPTYEALRYSGVVPVPVLPGDVQLPLPNSPVRYVDGPVAFKVELDIDDSRLQLGSYPLVKATVANWSPATYTTVPPEEIIGRAVSTAGVIVELRSNLDPYLVAMETTDGSLNFGTPAYEEGVYGIVLLVIGLVLCFVPQGAFCRWALCKLLRRRRERGLPRKHYAPRASSEPSADLNLHVCF